MRIDTIDVYHVKHPLIHPWRAGHGEETHIDAVLTKITSGSFSAWSESAPFKEPTYCPEYASSVFYLVSKVFAPLLVGEDISSAEELLDRLSCFKGNPFAKSAVEIAWWALQSKMDGTPLYKAIGGSGSVVKAGADICMLESIDELLQSISDTIDKGFERIKLKIKPGWDIEVLQAVRSAYPKFTFHVDCNSSYKLQDTAFFEQLDRFELAMIEQPLNFADLNDHAMLQKRINTPVCLDESCSSVFAARQAIELGSCKYMNIKPCRIGGLKDSVEIINMCSQAEIGCWIGSMLESSVGTGVCIALASLDNITYPGDLFPTNRFYTQEISEKRVELSSPGFMELDNIPGNPFEPMESELKKRTLNSTHID